eukprot:TRINITY_DN1579_c0_g1_i1.p1 TRINITY_DN1579_c0_g1~~TRINITY_DN1579_c0_g1_i1.p1  ORF type:complete len:505 (+),score=98.38 TRINITY_DN1579_c0_g1_i1:47-1561(+)
MNEFFFLFLIYCWAPCLSQHLRYVSKILPTTSSSSFSSFLPEEKDWIISQASYLDDPPLNSVLVRVSVPFSFPFLSLPYTSLLINPHGTLHFRKLFPCCIEQSDSCPLTSLTCTFDQSYDNFIGFLTDLAPASSASGMVRYSRSSSHVSVKYSDIFLRNCLNQGDASYSFIISLFSSGSILMRFLDVNDPTTSVCHKSALVGLRLPFGMDTDTLYMNEWNTTKPGVYVKRSAVRPNHSIAFCPISTRFCIYPSIALFNESSLVDISFDGHVDCAIKFNYRFLCRFTLSNGLFYDQPVVFLNASSSSSSSSFSVNLIGVGSCSTPVLSTAAAASVPAGSATLAILAADRDNASISQPFPFYFLSHDSLSSYLHENNLSSFDLLISPSFLDKPYIRSALFQQAFCSFCAPVSSLSFCWKDCSGVYLGNGTIDDCRVCNGNNSAKNCLGACFGPRFTRNRTECSPSIEQIQDIGTTLFSLADYDILLLFLTLAMIALIIVLMRFNSQ